MAVDETISQALEFICSLDARQGACLKVSGDNCPSDSFIYNPSGIVRLPISLTDEAPLMPL